MPIETYPSRELRWRGSPKLKLYKGGSREAHIAAGGNPKAIPAELPYFRLHVPDDSPFKAIEGEIISVWRALYGDEPTRLDGVQFEFDDPAVVFDDWMIEMKTSKQGNAMMVRKCTGRVIVWERVGDTISREPRPCQRDCKCKPSGRFNFVLPAFSRAIGYVVSFELVTHGQDDLDNIRSCLMRVHGATNGVLRNLPFVLYRKPTAKIDPSGRPITKHDVYLELADIRSMIEALPAPTQTAPQLPTGGGWATKEAINRLKDATRINAYADLCQVAGIGTQSKEEWEAAYPTFDAALAAITARLSALEAPADEAGDEIPF